MRNKKILKNLADPIKVFLFAEIESENKQIYMVLSNLHMHHHHHASKNEVGLLVCIQKVRIK